MKILLYIVVATIFSYPVMSFIAQAFNPAEWTETQRFVLSLMGIGLGGIMCIVDEM